MAKKRHDRDFYPTPPDVCAVLRDYLESVMPTHGPTHGVWLDPCAGMGALLEWAVPTVREYRVALEAHEPFAAALRERAGSVHTRDALSDERWPPGCSAVLNPPFRTIEAFFRRALDYRAVYDTWLAVLARTTWLSDGECRSPLRAMLELPENRITSELHCCWRPSFDNDGGDSAGVVWHVWAPRRLFPPLSTRVYRYERPAVPEEHWTEWKEMVRGMPAPRQQELDLGAA